MRHKILLVAFLLVACVPTPQGVPLEPVDPSRLIIFHNGVILTMTPDQQVVEAIAIRGEKIEALGKNKEILALKADGTTLIDLAGHVLMPGFIDAHTHILNDARSKGMSLDEAQYLALSNGITSLGDLYVDKPFLREIRNFATRGELRVRTSLYLVANTNCGDSKGDWYKKYPPTRRPGEMLRINGVKIFADGGSCGGVALSFELEPGRGQGDLWLTQAELNTMVAAAQAGGYQVAIHAIGDRAMEQAQESIASALDGGLNIFRHRMEHISVLRPEFIPQFGDLGILPVINGEYPSCTPFGPPIPDGYREWEWPWRELRSANPDLNIAWHSDYPFLSVNPFVHLYGFVTRKDVYQRYTCPPNGWLKDDTITVEQSLSIMTIQSAYALFREEEVGSLRSGKYADMIVISDDPLTVPVEALKDLKVLATMVGGRFEHCSSQNPELCATYSQRTPLPLPDPRPLVPVRWLVLIAAISLPLIAGLWYWRTRPRMWVPRLGGMAGVVGGGLWIWTIFSAQASNELMIWPMLIAGVLLSIAVVGLARLERQGHIGGLGLVTAWLGILITPISAILTSWFEIDIAFAFIWIGLLAHFIGLILVGLANWRASRRSLLNLMPLAVGALGGLLPFALSFISRESNWTIIMMGFGLGLGWIAMGVLAGRGEGRKVA